MTLQSPLLEKLKSILRYDWNYYICSRVSQYYKDFRNYYRQTIIISEKKEEQKSKDNDEAYILDIPKWKIKMIEESNP